MGQMSEGLFSQLPQELISLILSRTSPRHACLLSLVSSRFQSASDSDVVWGRFLPPDYERIASQAVDRKGKHSPLRYRTKKELYLRLSDHPILVDGGNKSFSLNRCTGNICYMLAARNLSILRASTPTCWKWTSVPQSRFVEVAELVSVLLLEIHGIISSSLLSPNTAYKAYLVFKLTSGAYGFEKMPAEVFVGIRGSQTEKRTAHWVPYGLQKWRNRWRNLGYPWPWPPKDCGVLYPEMREDGWWEIELGEYYNKEGKIEELEMSLWEVKGDCKVGLVVLGIEIRPKHSHCFGKPTKQVLLPWPNLGIIADSFNQRYGMFA